MQNPPVVPMPSTTVEQRPPRKKWPWVVGIGCLLVICICAIVGALFGGIIGGGVGRLWGNLSATMEAASTETRAIAAREYPDFTFGSTSYTTSNGVTREYVRLTSTLYPEFRYLAIYTEVPGSADASRTWKNDDQVLRTGGKSHDLADGLMQAFVRDHGTEGRLVTSIREQAAGSASGGDRMFRVETVTGDEPPSGAATDRTYTYAYRPKRGDWVQVVN
jgi:hypothetical protein